MNDTIPITYGEFYDFPRQIRFQVGGEWFFLRSFFGAEKEDYADSYDVFILPFRSEEEVKSHPNYWMELSSSVHLGQIPIHEVGLDETRRRSIDGEAFGKWLSSRKK